MMIGLRSVWLTIVFLAACLGPANAQSDDSSQTAQELRKELNDLREQMGRLQTRLDQLESNQAPAAAPSAAPATGQQQGTAQNTLPQQQGPSKQVGEATAAYQTFSEDSTAAPRYDNVPLDPKYHGFFRLPGTQTILKIGGYFKTDFIYDLKPAGNTDSFIPSSFPIPSVLSVNNSTISVRPTRLSLDFRVPTTKIGEVRFYLEGDLFGTNATTPRLRHA